MAELRFTIELPPVTKKNSQRIAKRGNKVFPIQSKAYVAYENSAIPFCPPSMIDFPVNIEAHYFMPTRRRVDITNLHSALHDVLVKAWTIEDDNCTIVTGTDGSRVHYDKEHPRTEIIITPSNDVDENFLKQPKQPKTTENNRG